MWTRRFFKSIFKAIQYGILDILQSVGILFIFFFFKMFPLSLASKIMGFLGRKVGMKLSIRKRAYQGLKLAFPELSEKEKDTIVAGMFENLLRTICEFSYLKNLRIQGPKSQVEIKGEEILAQLKKDGKGAILFSAHLSTWELGGYIASLYGLEMVHFYRKLNYYLVNKIITWRYSRFAPSLIAKGARGAREIMRAIEQGKHVSILTDQKFKEGEIIPFFNIPARTPAGGARLALKYDCPFVPVQVERIRGTSFRVTYHPPLESSKENPEEKVIDLLTQMNKMMEGWIRKHPEQWLWLHKRWS